MSDNERSGEAEEQTRPARAGETGETRFGMNESAAEEPPATGGPTATEENSSDEEAK